jgi:indole-3-glycerol phosphate synthase
LAGAHIIGVNNRDLRDFSVDLDTFGQLRRLIPEGVIAVAESGVHDGDDVRRLLDMGADAALVGEAIVTAPDTAAKVRDLVGGGTP